jgi:hypothetical protein
MKKGIITTISYPVRYTENVFVHADKTVRNSEGVLIGKYAGCELDGFATELTDRTFRPPSSDGGSGFSVVYMFVRKDSPYFHLDSKYYEVNWSGELKEISFFQLSLERLKKGRVKNILRFFSRISFSFKLRMI